MGQSSAIERVLLYGPDNKPLSTPQDGQGGRVLGVHDRNVLELLEQVLDALKNPAPTPVEIVSIAQTIQQTNIQQVFGSGPAGGLRMRYRQMYIDRDNQATSRRYSLWTADVPEILMWANFRTTTTAEAAGTSAPGQIFRRFAGKSITLRGSYIPLESGVLPSTYCFYPCVMVMLPGDSVQYVTPATATAARDRHGFFSVRIVQPGAYPGIFGVLTSASAIAPAGWTETNAPDTPTVDLFPTQIEEPGRDL